MSTFTAVIHKEENLYVAQCPEIGTASQGETIEDAIKNLQEATELYLEEFPIKHPLSRYLYNIRGLCTCLSCRKFPGTKP